MMGCLAAGESRLWADPFGLLRRDVRHAPRVPEVRGDYALTILGTGHPREAEGICRRALRLRPHPKVRVALAQSLSAQGRSEEAQAVLGKDPESDFVLLEAVDQAAKRGDREALERLAAKVEAMRAPGPSLILWLARRRAEGGDLAAGERILREHEAGLRANPLYWDHLGQILMTRGRDKDAEEAYRRATALDPSLFKSWNNLGRLLFKRGDRGGAAEAFRSALRAKPDYDLARKNLEAVTR